MQTSIGGQAVNEAVVIDFSRHLRSVLSIDPEQSVARAQPGVVLDDLRAAAAPHGLTFGPDPSTHNRCTRRADQRDQPNRHRPGRDADAVGPSGRPGPGS